MEREIAFGRLLAIANVLSKKVFESDKIKISDKYLSRYSKAPAKYFTIIHKELMEYVDKFGQDELQLLGLFEEILSEMDVTEFTNDPLNEKYLHAYYTQQHSLNNVVGVEDASKLWGLSPGTIKNYCAEGKIISKKIGNTWIIEKNQPNPSQAKKENTEC